MIVFPSIIKTWTGINDWAAAHGSQKTVRHHSSTIEMALRNYIRILNLHPSLDDPSAPVRYDLQSVALEDQPKYEALSYVWGQPGARVDVEISGRWIGITQSLHNALRRLRFTGAPRVLWVDQLCINQWDEEDKARQVRLMRRIYSQCQNCLIWLDDIPAGTSEADVDVGLMVLRDQAAAAVVDQNTIYGHDTPPLRTREELDSFIRLLQLIKEHLWWRRLWTVQEAVLPPSATIILGQHYIPWSVLIESIHGTWDAANHAQLNERIDTEPDFEHIFNHLGANLAWLANAKSGRDSATELIKRWRPRQATDVRDKVYGLLGLTMSGSLPYSEDCNYGRSARDVFCNLTYDMILSEGNLLPLILDPRLEEAKATPNMPRWAIDAADEPKLNTDWFHINSWPEYNAHGGRQLDREMLAAGWKTTTESLDLKGAFVDVIEVVGEPWINADRIFNRDKDLLVRHIKEWVQLARDHFKSRAHQLFHLGFDNQAAVDEHIGRLMLGDMIRNGIQNVERRAGGDDVAAFYNFLDTEEPNETYITIKGMALNRRFFITKTGLIGLGSVDTEPGDEVWVLHGGFVPFTLKQRERDNPADYDFRGHCYVQGIMDGEGFGFEAEMRKVTLY